MLRVNEVFNLTTLVRAMPPNQKSEAGDPPLRVTVVGQEKGGVLLFTVKPSRAIVELLMYIQ